MVLSDEQIARIARSVLEAPVSDGEAPAWSLAVGIARAIEAEVRKQDEALIRQLVEALEYHRDQTRPIDHTDSAIAAARARLEEKQYAYHTTQL